MHKSSTDAGGIREPDRQSDANHSIVASDILSANPVLRAKIVQNCQLSNAAAEDGLAEVIRFLDLCAGADARLTPSRAVDDAWHELILFTKAYHEFCEARFGRFIHHHPGGTRASNREGAPRCAGWRSRDDHRHGHCSNVHRPVQAIVSDDR